MEMHIIQCNGHGKKFMRIIFDHVSYCLVGCNDHPIVFSMRCFFLYENYAFMGIHRVKSSQLQTFCFK